LDIERDRQQHRLARAFPHHDTAGITISPSVSHYPNRFPSAHTQRADAPFAVTGSV
jgi:hypothetical protein